MNPKALLMLLLAVIVGIAFLNRGQFQIGTGPTGSTANVGYYGAVK